MRINAKVAGSAVRQVLNGVESFEVYESTGGQTWRIVFKVLSSSEEAILEHRAEKIALHSLTDSCDFKVIGLSVSVIKAVSTVLKGVASS